MRMRALSISFGSNNNNNPVGAKKPFYIDYDDQEQDNYDDGHNIDAGYSQKYDDDKENFSNKKNDQDDKGSQRAQYRR